MTNSVMITLTSLFCQELLRDSTNLRFGGCYPFYILGEIDFSQTANQLVNPLASIYAKKIVLFSLQNLHYFNCSLEMSLQFSQILVS
jgi:hypothetical protein